MSWDIGEVHPSLAWPGQARRVRLLAVMVDFNLFMPEEHESDCVQQHGHTSGTREDTCWTRGVPVVRWASLHHCSRLLMVLYLNLMELELEWDATLEHAKQTFDM